LYRVADSGARSGPGRRARRERAYTSSRIRSPRTERDLLTVGLAPEERLGELRGLIEGHLGRQRELEGIDHALHDHRARCRQRLLEHAPAVGGVLDREASSPARPGEQGEVHRLQLAPILGIAEKHDLLPFDLAERDG
jgi:hypothetical protein